MTADDSATARKLSGAPRLISPVEPGEVVYPSVGVRTYPAPAGTTVTISLEYVLAGTDVTSWRGGSSPETQLRLVTTGDFDPESPPSGVIKRAAWVVTIHDTKPIPLRGRHTGPPSDPTTMTCTSTVIVDAETSALLLNYQECRPAHSGAAG